jgi:hypothetical protein
VDTYDDVNVSWSVRVAVQKLKKLTRWTYMLISDVRLDTRLGSQFNRIPRSTDHHQEQDTAPAVNSKARSIRFRLW